MAAPWFRRPQAEPAAREPALTLLAVERLGMRFGGIQAVDDLSFSALAGQITALIGPNGAGKTTAFNCITGFYRPSAGTVTLTHEDSARFALHRLAGHRIAAWARVARTFQNIRLFAGMTALENLMVAQNRAGAGTLAALLRLPSHLAAERAARALATTWLTKLDLLTRADDAAGTLPYGAQRRLEIARAMCTRPVLLCLDEPAAGLNPAETDRLAELLLEIRDQCAILLIEHDVGLVMRVADQVVVMDRGRRIAAGPPATVQADPAVIAAYLGEPEP